MVLVLSMLFLSLDRLKNDDAVTPASRLGSLYMIEAKDKRKGGSRQHLVFLWGGECLHRRGHASLTLMGMMIVGESK